MNDSVTTIREEWQDEGGVTHGINIRFKGGCDLEQNFEYICLTCKEHTAIQHKRSDPMKGRGCPQCEGTLSRYHDKPPCIDADYHEGMLAHNIGWDENGG